MLKLGKILKPFGMKGEVKIASESEFLSARLAIGKTVQTADHKELKVASFRHHHGVALVRFEGIESMDDAEKLRDVELLVDEASIPPLKDGFYLFELVGMQVYDQNGYLGEVIEASKAAQTLLRIQGKEKVILVPYVPAFVKSVSREEKKILIESIEGLV
ncbi:MAG: ribosome maturation factor RimM [Erysipelotrichaceae bacterium]|jgi:16S rRNA processing protein RimM|nr:ribosome maturation factor RimM [Erysipelotrichaceae bacterium]